MIRVQLPPTAAQRLDRLFRTTTDRKFRDRLQIVRMAHRGRARQAIADDLGIDRRTLPERDSLRKGSLVNERSLGRYRCC